MTTEHLVNSLLGIGIIAAVVVIIYLKVKKMDFTEFIKEINLMFEDKNGK